jgi:hypothetical protein
LVVAAFAFVALAVVIGLQPRAGAQSVADPIQVTSVGVGPKLPGSCRPSGGRFNIYHLTVTDGLHGPGIYRCSATNTWTLAASGGTVTSVAATLPNIFSLAGSPVTTSGTLAVTLATQSANRVWAGPTTGSAAAPTFRALVNADVPSALDGHSIGGTTPGAGAFTVLRSGVTASLATTDPVDVSTVNATGNVIPYTPSQSATVNAASVTGTAGQDLTFVVTTGGTSSFTITFGTHFKSVGTLATGTVSGKVFVVRFVSDGVNYNEVARTVAM